MTNVSIAPNVKRSVHREIDFNASLLFDRSSLIKRAPITWAAANNKGHALVCLVEATQADATTIAAGLFPVTSQFSSVTDIRLWGWIRVFAFQFVRTSKNMRHWLTIDIWIVAAVDNV